MLQSGQNSDRLCGLVVRLPGYRSRGPGYDSRRYEIFWEVVGLERDPLSLVSTTEELLGRNSSGSGLRTREYGHRNPLRWPRDTIHQQKLALTSPTSGGRLVGIVRSRTKATEFFLSFFCLDKIQVTAEEKGGTISATWSGLSYNTGAVTDEHGIMKSMMCGSR
jgi:hypothetical protein